MPLYPNNTKRIDRADSVVRNYCVALGDASQPEDFDTLTAVLSDLMHFAAARGHNFSAAVDIAVVNYQEESLV